MDKFRGILMLGVGGFALYRGLLGPHTQRAWMAVVLGVVAIALGIWRMLRKTPPRLV